MSTIRRIYKNIVFLSSAELISKIFQFVLMVYAARLLDKASFGKFSFALSLSFIAVIIADLGINTLLIREIARDKSKVDKYFTNAFVAKAPAPRALPALNPNHPNQSRAAPRIVKGMLCIAMGLLS